MKLINLIPLREIEDVEAISPELIATPFFREFQAAHGYKPIFKYIGTKADEMMFTADLSDLGQLDLIIKEAQIMAKITEKQAVFGIIYTCTSLEQWDAPVCLMKKKDGVIEHIPYDIKDKKNFDASTVKFLKLIQNEK